MKKKAMYYLLLVGIILLTSVLGRLVFGPVVQEEGLRSPWSALVLFYPGAVLAIRHFLHSRFYQQNNDKIKYEFLENIITCTAMMVGLVYWAFLP
ncbi:MAG: hypothetical protein ACRC46_00090 [Thermoguttaceae bacterium]